MNVVASLGRHLAVILLAFAVFVGLDRAGVLDLTDRGPAAAYIVLAVFLSTGVSAWHRRRRAARG